MTAPPLISRSGSAAALGSNNCPMSTEENGLMSLQIISKLFISVIKLA